MKDLPLEPRPTSCGAADRAPVGFRTSRHYSRRAENGRRLGGGKRHDHRGVGAFMHVDDRAIAKGEDIEDVEVAGLLRRNARGARRPVQKSFFAIDQQGDFPPVLEVPCIEKFAEDFPDRGLAFCRTAKRRNAVPRAFMAYTASWAKSFIMPSRSPRNALPQRLDGLFNVTPADRSSLPLSRRRAAVQKDSRNPSSTLVRPQKTSNDCRSLDEIGFTGGRRRPSAICDEPTERKLKRSSASTPRENFFCLHRSDDILPRNVPAVGRLTATTETRGETHGLDLQPSPSRQWRCCRPVRSAEARSRSRPKRAASRQTAWLSS